MTYASPSFAGDDRPRSAGLGLSLTGRWVDRALPALQAGRLQLALPNGEVIERRGSEPGPDARICAHRWRALWRILSGGEDGFADGYLDGDWSTPDLLHVLEFCARNEAALTQQTANSKLGLARNRVLHWLHANTPRGSRRNIAAHYDLGNDFFSPWLDCGMNYSSALYADGGTLEAAQEAKLDRIASLLDIKRGERILEIGCGWGALAERLLRRFGATVSAITLSTEQLEYARARLASEVEHRSADLQLMDYRNLTGQFDRIVSIEMVEAVGERYWPAYFAKLRASLRQNGVAVLQAITIAEHRFAAYRNSPDFIQRYIFPGGLLPTRSTIERQASLAGLTLVHHEAFGGSYAKTLGEWRARFLAAWPRIEKLGFNDRFRRMWEYYLTYCEVGFRTGIVDVGLFKLTAAPSSR
jgi:cyclopropane-fatty-acyl-phospholipid synthase